MVVRSWLLWLLLFLYDCISFVWYSFNSVTKVVAYVVGVVVGLVITAFTSCIIRTLVACSSCELIVSNVVAFASSAATFVDQSLTHYQP